MSSRRRSSGPKFGGKLSKRLPFAPLLNVVLPKISPDVPAVLDSLPEQTVFMREFLARIAEILDTPSEEAVELDERFALLFEHYGIHSTHVSRWQLLAGCLAQEFIPGFMEGAKAGAPRRWTQERLAALRREVEELTSGGLTAKAACRRLLKNPDGTFHYQGCHSVGTLYRRYLESKQ